MESLAVVRSIFCALSPVHLINGAQLSRRGVPRRFHIDPFVDGLQFGEQRWGDRCWTPIVWISRGLLDILERFDHLPANDHCDQITAISGCSRLKLIATGSLDGTLRIWNGKNQLIRYKRLILWSATNFFPEGWLSFMTRSIPYISPTIPAIWLLASAIICIKCLICLVSLTLDRHGWFDPRWSSLDLPKVIVFKTVSMQFKSTVPESKESEQIDHAQLTRMPSADLIRLKRAHKAELMFVAIGSLFTRGSCYFLWLDPWMSFLKTPMSRPFMPKPLNKWNWRTK